MGLNPEELNGIGPATRRLNPDVFKDSVANPTITAKALLDAVNDEEKLHGDIIKFCRDNGWIYFHGSMAHKAMRTVGEPDFTLLADRGRVFFIECKTKTGKLSPEQLTLKLWAEKLGHTIHTVRSMSEFKEIVK